jgi:hypothetical protein
VIGQCGAASPAGGNPKVIDASSIVSLPARMIGAGSLMRMSSASISEGGLSILRHFSENHLRL